MMYALLSGFKNLHKILLTAGMGYLQCFLYNVAAINFVIQFILFPVMSLAQEMLTKVSHVYMYLQMALILRVGCTSAHVHVQSI